MKTNQVILFTVHTAQFKFIAFNEKLSIVRSGNSQVLDTFDMDNDPVDYVADAICEMFIELCPCDIETDEEVIKLSEEVYLTTNCMFTLREFTRNRDKKTSTNESV